MRTSTKSSWQQAFTKRFASPSFRGTGWEGIYAKLSQHSATSARSAKPLWVGVELVQPDGLGYTGVLCADGIGEVLCASELQTHTSALDAMRTQWPGAQLRFLTDLNDLRSAARRSHVFGAVADAASPAALSLAKSLARKITLGNARTALRVLSVVSPPSSRRGASPAGTLPPAPPAFDVLLQCKTTKPWLEHRDLAVMCAVQKDGLIGIDFTQVLGIFKESGYTGGQWFSKRLGRVGVKSLGVARGPGRAGRAAKKALRQIAASMPLSRITGGIIDIGGDLRLAEIKAVMETIRAACPEETEFVLGCDARGQGPLLRIALIAVSGGPDAAANHQSALPD